MTDAVLVDRRTLRQLLLDVRVQSGIVQGLTDDAELRRESAALAGRCYALHLAIDRTTPLDTSPAPEREI